MLLEILGPSSAGKSSALRMAAKGRSGRPWFTPSEISTLIESDPGAMALRRAMDAPELRELMDWCLSATVRTTMTPAQKVAALTLLRRSCFDSQQVRGLSVDRPVLHDELILHRAFSLLPRSEDAVSEARDFFRLAPVPDAAIVFSATPDDLLERVRKRKGAANCYLGLDDEGLRVVVQRCVDIAAVATEELGRRGVAVRTIDASGPVKAVAGRLSDAVTELLPPPGDDPLRDRLLSASGSFRKGTGRHELRTSDVMYCAFSIPGFTVSPSEAQRDAARRTAKFGLDEGTVRGKQVLDLGCNAGAMLFQLSNHAPAAALGVEYDVDKAQLAAEIAAEHGVENVEFRQGDVDELTAEDLGTHDIVLALAIEAHVRKPERLYRLLGQVTRDLLCFEGNAGCDMDEVRRRLADAGFGDFVDLGFCDDDIDERNNRRPQLLARKQHPAAGRSWWRRARG